MIKVGSIVTVVNEEYYFFDHQGKVVEQRTEDAEIIFRLEFGPASKSSTQGFDKEELSNQWFPGADLRHDSDWSVENKVLAVYSSNNWHHARLDPNPFMPGNDCMVENCQQPAEERILFNTWGTVTDYEVCREHSCYHGMCGDMFPLKKNWHPKEEHQLY